MEITSRHIDSTALNRRDFSMGAAAGECILRQGKTVREEAIFRWHGVALVHEVEAIV